MGGLRFVDFKFMDLRCRIRTDLRFVDLRFRAGRDHRMGQGAVRAFASGITPHGKPETRNPKPETRKLYRVYDWYQQGRIRYTLATLSPKPFRLSPKPVSRHPRP